MSYTDPTLDTFVTAFPEFEDVESDVFDPVLAAAKQTVDVSWSEGDYTRALMLVIAHILATSGSSGDAAISSESLGPLSMSYKSAVADGGTTSYSNEFAIILRRNKPAIAVV
jgi:hypothetical protein